MRGDVTTVDVAVKLSARHVLKTQKDYLKKTRLNMTRYVTNVILKLPILSYRVGLNKLEYSKIKLNNQLISKKIKLIY